MWRDILIIAAFVLAALTYFGLTPRWLSEYAKTAKGEITKESLSQKVLLFCMIAATLFYILSAIWELEAMGLSNFLIFTSIMLTSIYVLLWSGILGDVWKSSERRAKVVRVVVSAAIVSLLVAGVVLSDMRLWQKLAYPWGGVGIGFGIHVLEIYIRKKREDKRPAKEDDT